MPVPVADTEDGIEEVSTSGVAVLSDEAAGDVEAASPVEEGEAVMAVASLVSSCRGSGRATPAKTILKHRRKHRRTPHIRGDGLALIMCD